jgi:hypothetical protein
MILSPSPKPTPPDPPPALPFKRVVVFTGSAGA